MLRSTQLSTVPAVVHSAGRTVFEEVILLTDRCTFMQTSVMCVICVLNVSILIAEHVHDACNWNILGMCVACV